MTYKNDKAFPKATAYQDGMSILDYFAAKAMQAILSREKAPEGCESYESIAEMAYEMADAMINVRQTK